MPGQECCIRVWQKGIKMADKHGVEGILMDFSRVSVMKPFITVMDGAAATGSSGTSLSRAGWEAQQRHALKVEAREGCSRKIQDEEEEEEEDVDEETEDEKRANKTRTRMIEDE